MGLEPKLDLTSHWQREIADHLAALKKSIIRGSGHVQAQLDEWRRYTIRSCKLDPVVNVA